MLITGPQSIGPVNAITYSITNKNAFSQGKTYGAVYWDATKPGMKPVVTVQYDESKPKALRGLVKCEFDLGARADGSIKKATVNFTEVFPDDATDAEVENCISFAKLLYAIANFNANFVDRVA